jgi:stearoyl-CoA desaturase (delta-9 desaturase)
MIWTLSKVGLTSNLRRVSDAKILLAEMREAQRLIEQKREAVEVKEFCPVREKTEEMIEALSDRLTNCFAQIDEAISSKVELSKSALKEMHVEVRAVVKGIGKVKPLAT